MQLAYWLLGSKRSIPGWLILGVVTLQTNILNRGIAVTSPQTMEIWLARLRSGFPSLVTRGKLGYFLVAFCLVAAIDFRGATCSYSSDSASVPYSSEVDESRVSGSIESGTAEPSSVSPAVAESRGSQVEITSLLGTADLTMMMSASESSAVAAAASLMGNSATGILPSSVLTPDTPMTSGDVHDSIVDPSAPSLTGFSTESPTNTIVLSLSPEASISNTNSLLSLPGPASASMMTSPETLTETVQSGEMTSAFSAFIQSSISTLINSEFLSFSTGDLQENSGYQQHTTTVYSSSSNTKLQGTSDSKQHSASTSYSLFSTELQNTDSNSPTSYSSSLSPSSTDLRSTDSNSPTTSYSSSLSPSSTDLRSTDSNSPTTSYSSSLSPSSTDLRSTDSNSPTTSYSSSLSPSSTDLRSTDSNSPTTSYSSSLSPSSTDLRSTDSNSPTTSYSSSLSPSSTDLRSTDSNSPTTSYSSSLSPSSTDLRSTDSNSPTTSYSSSLSPSRTDLRSTDSNSPTSSYSSSLSPSSTDLRSTDSNSPTTTYSSSFSPSRTDLRSTDSNSPATSYSSSLSPSSTDLRSTDSNSPTTTYSSSLSPSSTYLRSTDSNSPTTSYSSSLSPSSTDLRSTDSNSPTTTYSSSLSPSSTYLRSTDSNSPTTSYSSSLSPSSTDLKSTDSGKISATFHSSSVSASTAGFHETASQQLSRETTSTDYTLSTAGFTSDYSSIISTLTQRLSTTGACSGNATLNRCGYCVGGGSKLPETHGEDCNGECNGNAVVDSCGFCVMGSTSSRRYYGSEFKDCNGTCHSPATINKMATNSSDTCFTCLLAGDPLPDGLKDACGVCYGDNSTCKDCDGIPNGGKTLDACGVCGGPGDSCLAVRSVSPSIVPGDTTKTLAIAGAGFDGSLDCLAQQVPSENVTIATRTSALTMVDMTCQFSLKPGDYKIFVRTPDGNLSSSNATLRVYSSKNVIATAVSPMSFTLEGEEVVLNITASGLQAVLCMLSDVPVKGKLTIEGSLSDTGATCTLPRLTKSGNFSLRLSMNAVDLIEGSFELIAFAAAPKVISLKFSKTGAEVIMRFNKMVDTEHLIGCSSIFKNVSKLGDGAICKWPSNFSLRIEVGKGDNLIKPGDSLTFVLNATKVLGEAYSRAAEGSVTIGNQTSLRPRAIITGPAEVPSCGEVELSGERSSGGGGRSLEFTWILDYSDGETENVTKLLKESSRSGGKKRITLVASDLTANRTYRLAMGVRNFFGESGFVTFDVKRESIPKPVVFISSSLDRSSVKSTDRVILTANAQLPVCAEESSVQFLWSVDDPRVRVDETTGTFRKYLIRENTLPSNSKVTFHVRANFQNDSTRFSTASIALNVRETALVAVTNGGHGRRVGVNSTDKVVISANQSYDPDTPTDGPKSLSFVWSCRRHKASEKQFESCFSMLPGETTFPTATERSRSTLEFSPRRLQPNYFYLFKVVVRKDTRNAQREVVIEAVPGSPPQVVMENLPNQIMPNRQLRILMYANSSSPVTVLWMQAYAGEPGHGYINFQDPATLVGGRPVMGNASTKDSYFSFIEIEAGKLLQGMKYGVRVKVKNVNSEEGSGLVMFSVASDVQSCTLMAPENYTVLNTITLDVAGCSTGVSAYPLQYQFFTEQAPGEYRSISSRFFLPRITIPGPPLDGGRGKTTFVVEVCNRFATCKSFSSGGVTVEQQEDAESLKAAIDKGKKELATYIKTGNFIQALVNLVSLIKAKDRLSSVQRTKRDSTAPERDSDELLVLVDRALSQKSSLDAGAAGTIISQMKMLNVSSLAVSDQRRVLLHFQTLIGLFGIDRVSLQLDHLEFLAHQIAAADPENGDAVRRTLHLLLLTAPGPFSTPRTFVSPHFALKEKRTMLDGLETFQYGGKTVQISFNAEMKNRYSDWACGSKRCLGLTIRFVSQPRSDQFYRPSDHRKKIVSDIIDISLFSENADPVEVANLTDLIQFVTTIRTQQADGLYRCAYWARNTWSSDTLETKIKDTAGTVQCQTPHLTTFAIIFTPHNQTVSTPASYIMKENLGNNGNKGALIGGIVGGMTGLIVLIVVLVLVIRHFKMKNTKISAINIQPAAAEGT